MLRATATVIGAFDQWACRADHIQLAAGDLLVAYSDGVTEAEHGEEQFGEERLLAVLRDHATDSPERIVSVLLARVQAFSAGPQSDDLTLLVARVR
jgi:sigma-B regulation protein RsbU (phosphoserine phosphatase)